MPLRGTKNATVLLHIAQDWFKSNPDEPMPADAWASMAETMVNPGQLNVQDAGFAPIFENPALIPAFAAITLGATTEQLSKIVMHHGVTAKMYSQIVGTNLNEDKTARVDSNKLSSWNLAYQLMQALTLDREYGLTFAKELQGIPVDACIQVACLLTEFEELWPVTHIREYMRKVDAGEVKVGDSKPEMTGARSMQYVQTNLDRFTDEQLINLLERSGNLCLGANKEYGYANTFFKEYFKYLVNPQYTNVTMLSETISRIKDPALIETFKLRLHEDMANADFSATSAGSPYLQMIADKDSIWPGVASSTVLKLNILAFDKVILSRIHDKQNPGNFLRHPFYNHRHTVLQDLNGELTDLDATSLRSEHFRALHRLFVDWPYPQNLHFLDLKALMHHVLTGWDAYQARQNDPRNGFVPNLHDVTAAEHLGGFIRFVAANTEHDYSEFSQLSSPVKALLAKNDYDIKQLPGIGLRDKGRILEQGLGL
jgi:hypothetical protein